MASKRPVSRRSMLAGLGAGALAGFTSSAGLAKAGDVLTITGEIAYLQRIALPDDAIAIAELRPADQPDSAPATAELRMPLGGAQVPVAFAMEVERARLAADESYILRAGIRVGGELRWLSGPVPVDVTGASVDAGTIVVRPFRTLSPFDVVEYGDLEGGDWQVVEIDGARVDAESAFTLGFGDAGGFHGRACNRFRGTYRLDNATIAFGNAAATMMACPEPLMALERNLFRALEATRHASIEPDGTLALADSDGNVVLRARRQA